MDRKGYQKLQAQARRESAETLNRFKALYPEKYQELLERARKEVNEPAPERPVVRYSLVRTKALTKEDIDRIVYDPKEREYYIRAKDRWGKEHTFFESLIPKGFTDSTVLEMLIQKHSRYDVTTLVAVEPCQCPACIRRHDVS